MLGGYWSYVGKLSPDCRLVAVQVKATNVKIRIGKVRTKSTCTTAKHVCKSANSKLLTLCNGLRKVVIALRTLIHNHKTMCISM